MFRKWVLLTVLAVIMSSMMCTSAFAMDSRFSLFPKKTEEESDEESVSESDDDMIWESTGDEELRDSSDDKKSRKSDGPCRSYLTGMEVSEEIGRKRPFALMIENDLDAAAWQAGTSYADVVYEARVEGGITRLEAIFEDFKDASMIMPIRSCRPQFVYYANEFEANYGHYGQVIYAVPILQLPQSCDIAGLPYGESGQEYRLIDGSSAYSRDHAGVTGVFTTYDKLQNFVKEVGWDTDYPEDYKGHYQFAEDNREVNLTGGETANVVIPGFVSNHARFDYDKTDKLYYRSEFGEPQIDHLNDQQLAYKNIIIQIGPSVMLDDHYLFTDPVCEGKAGKGWYITNGKAMPITWKKENWSKLDPVIETITTAKYKWDVRDCDFNVTRYYDASGKEITLNQGKTFVEIVRDEDASKVLISDDPEVSTNIIDGM